MKDLLLYFVQNKLTPIIGHLLIRKNKYCNVIYYHDIVQGKGDSFDFTNIDVFKQHMQYIKEKGYQTLTFDELEEVENVKYCNNRVIIAFDDGWKSNYDMIFDFMRENGIKYNVYLAVGKIGLDENYLTWDQVREMHNSGLVGFGTHTYNHVSMKNINSIDISIEVNKANAVFEKQLGYEPHDFCYPYGFYSDLSNSYLVEKSPYTRIYTSEKMFSYIQDGKIIFGRSGISNDQSMDIFIYKLRGFYNAYHFIENILLKPFILIKHILIHAK